MSWDTNAGRRGRRNGQKPGFCHQIRCVVCKHVLGALSAHAYPPGNPEPVAVVPPPSHARAASRGCCGCSHGPCASARTCLRPHAQDKSQGSPLLKIFNSIEYERATVPLLRKLGTFWTAADRPRSLSAVCRATGQGEQPSRVGSHHARPAPCRTGTNGTRGSGAREACEGMRGEPGGRGEVGNRAMGQSRLVTTDAHGSAPARSRLDRTAVPGNRWQRRSVPRRRDTMPPQIGGHLF